MWYAVSDRVNLAAGGEWRDEQFGLRAGDRAGWMVGPYASQRFMAGSNGVFAYSPPQAGAWSRHNVAAYGDLEVTDPDEAWTLGAAVRMEDFEDFGTTTNGKVSGRAGFVRGSVSTGFRAPTPGQQHGLNIHSWFDPMVGDLVNNAVIPSVSPVALLRGGAPLAPETSINYTAGVVFGGGPFTLTADYFRIDVSDRIGITSNFVLTPVEIAEVVAGGFEAAESVRNYRFFTNAFGTTSQGIDVVSTWTPLALRGNTVISAVFNHTDTEVTDNDKGCSTAGGSRSTPTRCRAPAGTPASRNGSGGRACRAVSATTAAGTTTTAGAERSSIPRAGWNRASSTAGRSSTWS